MEYCVDILWPTDGSLEDGNLRGERRWERQVARALLDAERTVCTPRPDTWKTPDTPLWRGYTTGVAGQVLLTHADPGTVRYRSGARVFLSNVFTPLNADGIDEVRRAVREMGQGRVFLTCSFQARVGHLNQLPVDIRPLLHWLPVPAVPGVHWEHKPFDNKTLLWYGRAIHLSLMDPTPAVVALLDWIQERLLGDTSLRFEVLAGDEGISRERAEQWIWGLPAFEKAFSSLREQVTIHPSLSWPEVQQVFARTKLAVSPPGPFGGSAIEGASFGIPIVGPTPGLFHTVEDGQAIPAFPEYVGLGAEYGLAGNAQYPSFVETLDAWDRDRDRYVSTGSAYRAFVDQTYTHAAFVRRLDTLLEFL